MNYLEIADLVFTVLLTLLGLLTVHYAVFFLIGLFTKKKFPHTEDKRKYGVIVSARNEQAVIKNLIESIRKCNYPQELIEIFVVAHNCTDGTAEVSRNAGATVYEYDNENEKTKGYALKYLFDKIKSERGIDCCDGYLVLDADNILAEDYFEKMNDAFVANGCNKVITSFRNAKNFGYNIISALYGIFFMQNCRFEMRGRTVTGCSTRVSGTGFLFSNEVVKDGWKYVTITEDWEFSADQVLENNKIVYCDDAVLYDEQPTSVKIMLRQRLRWQRGHLIVCITRLKYLLKSLFKSKKRGGSQHKGSVYDISVNILPLMVISASVFIVNVILLAFAPLFGFDAAAVWTSWAWGLVKSAVPYYATTFFTAILLLIVERKRIKNTSVWLKIAALFVWPLFLFLSTPIEFIALFKRNLAWKTIPHNDTTDFDKIHSTNAKKPRKLRKTKA